MHLSMHNNTCFGTYIYTPYMGAHHGNLLKSMNRVAYFFLSKTHT